MLRRVFSRVHAAILNPLMHRVNLICNELRTPHFALPHSPRNFRSGMVRVFVATKYRSASAASSPPTPNLKPEKGRNNRPVRLVQKNLRLTPFYVVSRRWPSARSGATRTRPRQRLTASGLQFCHSKAASCGCWSTLLLLFYIHPVRIHAVQFITIHGAAASKRLKQYDFIRLI